MRRIPVHATPAVLLDPFTDLPMQPPSDTHLSWDKLTRILCLTAGLRAKLDTFEIDDLRRKMLAASDSVDIPEAAWEAFRDEIKKPTLFIQPHLTSPESLAVLRAIVEAPQVT